MWLKLWFGVHKLRAKWNSKIFTDRFLSHRCRILICILISCSRHIWAILIDDFMLSYFIGKSYHSLSTFSISTNCIKSSFEGNFGCLASELWNLINESIIIVHVAQSALQVSLDRLIAILFAWLVKFLFVNLSRSRS